MVTSTSSSSELKSPDQLLDEAAETYRKRNAIYGDNFRLFPQVMLALFPDGLHLVTYEDWMRIQFVMLDVVKSTRYAQNFHVGGHADSARDKAVYSAMLEATDAEAAYLNANRQSETANGNNGQLG